MCFPCLGYHGDKGPLVVTDVRSTSIAEAFLNAGKELGYKYVDLNGEEGEGTSYLSFLPFLS